MSYLQKHKKQRRYTATTLRQQAKKTHCSDAAITDKRQASGDDRAYCEDKDEDR
jgi:hypothetical protein